MHHLCLIVRVPRVWPLLLCVGCASVGGVQTANTVGKGGLEIGVEPGLQVLGGTTATQLYPHLDAAVRYGFTERLDLGLRAGWSFFEAQAKYQLTQPGVRGLVLSVAPTMGGSVVLASGSTAAVTDSLGGILSASTPVLLGIPVGAHQLVLGVRTQHFFFIRGTAPNLAAYLLGVGGSVGFALRFNDSLVLLPEVAGVWPVFGGLSATSSDGVHPDYLYGTSHTGIFQFKLGFLLDRRVSPTSP